jgi:phospholipid/cholesterol/gamma-HCH transport system permease protein
MRGADVLHFVQATGPGALFIVGLIALLVGMIFAFIGAIQLALFGAEIYVANLVSLAMLREMGAVMAAVAMAGRTGAAYAAEIGTMQVNEEVDALVTSGLSPVAFLVLPRLLALVLMMPLLTLYSNALGIAGGAMIGIFVLDIAAPVYLEQSLQFIGPKDLMVGLIKAFAFGAVVALAGCYHGIRCGRSSAAVGQAATQAVVAAIVLIIVVDSGFTVLFHVLGV